MIYNYFKLIFKLILSGQDAERKRPVLGGSQVMKLIATLLICFQWVACGYSFQTSRNPLFLKEGIRKIYVSSLVNNTYKAGVENIVYNSLVRTLVASGKLILVQHPADADAILQGTVDTAAYVRSAALSSVSTLNPIGLGGKLPTAPFAISTEYSATLSCNFRLIRRNPRPGKVANIWSSSFSRNKPFPAANQLDVPGTTSALINESEFERTLSDLSNRMMDDVNESMLSMF
jgi:hypothetical protein